MMSVTSLLPKSAFVAAVLILCQAAGGEPKIEWDSDQIVESRMTQYQYHHVGPEYEKPEDKDAPNPGRNFMIELTVADEPPRLLDRVLKRTATISGAVKEAPPQAQSAHVWLEDNYGRVLDEEHVGAPVFAFRLNASRSLGTGIYLKAELHAGPEQLWSGVDPIRLVPTDEDPWRDFILGVYNMGTRPGTGKLFRDMGLGHRAIQTTGASTFPVQNDLRFHASNILYSLLGFYHRDLKRWREIKQAQGESTGPVTLTRHRCLSNPKEQKFTTDILTAAALRHRPYEPLHYGIGDEIGIGNMCGPYDLCGSAWCKHRFRWWLQGRYRELDALNAQWGTRYRSWGDVEMFSTWQALERTESGNFSPWADRVEFMDDVLLEGVALGVRTVRALDPQARCSITGVQQPSCWGYDLWKLTRVVDVTTPYDIGEGPDVIMSFHNDGADGKVVDPGFGSDNEDLWRAFVRGYDMVQQWDSFGDVYSKMIDIENQRLTPLGEQVKQFADWVHAGPGRLRNRAQRVRDPVAILYSQPSLRGNWILEICHRIDVPQTGRDWPGRDSWTVRQKELSFRVRMSWAMWLHDIGIRPRYVDVSQIRRGYLLDKGYKVLVLPRAVALSDDTAHAIRRFVEAGGTVIADSWPGIMDQACRVRPRGVLDDLFGVRRGDYRKIDVTRMPPSGQGVAVNGNTLPFFAFEKALKAEAGQPGGGHQEADVAITRAVGQGHAIYLNFNLEEYFLQRFFPRMVAPARRYLLTLLGRAGVRPLFAVTSPDEDALFHPVGHDVVLYRNGRGYVVGTMINPTVRTSELGGIESRYEFITDNVFLEDAHPSQLTIPKGLFTYDLVERKALGDVRSVKMISARTSGHVFACWPFEIENLTAQATTVPGHRIRVTGNVATSTPVENEKLVVAMRVYRPDGAEQPVYRRTIDCDRNVFAVDWPLGVNEHGQWSVVVTEPCTGKSVSLNVEVPKPAPART